MARIVLCTPESKRFCFWHDLFSCTATPSCLCCSVGLQSRTEGDRAQKLGDGSRVFLETIYRKSSAGLAFPPPRRGKRLGSPGFNNVQRATFNLKRREDPRRRRPAPLRAYCCRLDQHCEDLAQVCRLNVEQGSRQAFAAVAVAAVSPLAGPITFKNAFPTMGTSTLKRSPKR
jgi:hypothetical protein